MMLNAATDDLTVISNHAATDTGQSGGPEQGEKPADTPEESESTQSPSAPTLALTPGEETITASWTAVYDAPHGCAIRWRTATSGSMYNDAERRTTTFESIVNLTAGQEYEVRVDVLANDTTPYQFATNRHVTAKATPTASTGNEFGIGSVNPPAPSVRSVSATSNSGSDNTYERGDTITVNVAFDQSVAVTGTPTVAIKMDPSY